MNFSEIKPAVTEFSRLENKSSFDIDKRAELPTKQDIKDNKDFDIDKRTELQQNNYDLKNSNEINEIKYDDNGNIYREGSELLPNNTYEVNGYIYKTDEKGRIISAEGKLQQKDHEDRNVITEKMSDIGKGDERDSDDRGHLIGDRFNGSGGLENLVPQDASLNRVEINALENALAKAVTDVKDVYLKVEPTYSENSHRPDSFTYTYTVDGEKSVKIFKNGE